MGRLTDTGATITRAGLTALVRECLLDPLGEHSQLVGSQVLNTTPMITLPLL